MKKILFFVLFSMNQLIGQEIIKIYGENPPPFIHTDINKVPDFEKWKTKEGIELIKNISTPTLTVFLPKKPNGTAVVICPGGGYWVQASGHEGNDVARQLNEWGVTAFVLAYRLPTTPNLTTSPSFTPLADAQAGIAYVRNNAKKFKVNPNRIGILGFSAGGHLAGTASVLYNYKNGMNTGTSVRPDFSVLIYPVLSFDQTITHSGSAEALIGKTPSKELTTYFSCEKQVNSNTPPAFLVHSSDDDAVPVQNVISYYSACLKVGVLCELHIYPKGGHGYGMKNPTTIDYWPDRLKNWLIALFP